MPARVALNLVESMLREQEDCDVDALLEPPVPETPQDRDDAEAIRRAAIILAGGEVLAP